jgi:hypothetical protein
LDSAQHLVLHLDQIVRVEKPPVRNNSSITSLG